MSRSNNSVISSAVLGFLILFNARRIWSSRRRFAFGSSRISGSQPGKQSVETGSFLWQCSCNLRTAVTRVWPVSTGERVCESPQVRALRIDESEVVPDRPTQSISVEDTFAEDVPLSETEPMIRRLAEKLRSASRKESRIARTVVLKLKTSQFRILTRSYTPDSPPSSCEELTDIALKLRQRVDLGPQQCDRLVGVGLSNFREPEGTTAQPVRFE